MKQEVPEIHPHMVFADNLGDTNRKQNFVDYSIQRDRMGFY